MYYVVGTGPAGISCAQALIAAGKEVTILDAGLQLDAERRQAIRSLAATNSSQWNTAATDFLRNGIIPGTSGIPLKLAYGSDFPYRQIAGATAIRCEGAESKPSYACGGLSTVWGAAIMPHRQQDIEDWPISIMDLEPGYRAVFQWMPLSAQNDDLAKLFPLYIDECASLPASRQAAGMLADLQRNRAKLYANGIHFGSSRLAVNADNRHGRPDCVQCGLCMYGCPYGLIYSSDQTLAVLVATGRVHYKPGVIVQSVEEIGTGVRIRAVDHAGNLEAYSGERVFLGAGVLNTTTILLRSMVMYDRPVQIRDSQYFLMPLLRLRGTADVVREPLHTLAQLFVEIFDTSISPYTIHLQTYTYNDLFCSPVLAALGPFKKLFPFEAFLGHLMLFQGYLHSAHSSSITATLSHNQDGNALTLRAVPNPEVKKRVGKLAFKLAKLVAHTGVLPIIPMIQMGKPGRGFHSGGSFPMSRQPKTGETDILGRPRGLQRVHAIDSTVLPSIPATAITYTVMANAYRIGSLAAMEIDRSGQ
jgi:choline dehydrogenase-like flavoprotein